MTPSIIALAASSAEAAAESKGLPQLDLTTFGSQIFWLAVALVALFFLLSRIALPRIASVLEERADAIASDLDQADEYRRKAEDAEKAYEQALADARAKAQGIAAETRAEIQKDVNAAIAKADAEIAARTAESEKRIAEIRENAMAAVDQVATETAEAVVEAVLPGTGGADAVKAAVQNRLGG